MSATRTATRTPASPHRAARLLVLIALTPAAAALSVSPAQASPWAGDRVPAAEVSVVWGWPGGADGPAYPGQRFGANLPAQLRGPVLEFLDR